MKLVSLLSESVYLASVLITLSLACRVIQGVPFQTQPRWL
jgi:hypothetical protein